MQVNSLFTEERQQRVPDQTSQKEQFDLGLFCLCKCFSCLTRAWFRDFKYGISDFVKKKTEIDQ